MSLRLTFADESPKPEPIKMNPGVEAALKMREDYQRKGYKCYLDIEAHQSISIKKLTVARLYLTTDTGFFRVYYFYEDGTYYNGSN